MIENKKTDLPPEIQNLYRSHEQKASEFAENNNYSAAEQEYKTLLLGGGK